MANKLAPYENQFTIEERKKFIAQTMRDLRRASGLSQKEAAAEIGISQATYSAYEKGRNGPPAEILVRLSYLFNCSIDILTQRERLFRTSKDVNIRVENIQKQLQELENAMTDKGGDKPIAKNLLDSMNQLAVQIKQLNQNPIFTNQIN